MQSSAVSFEEFGAFFKKKKLNVLLPYISSITLSNKVIIFFNETKMNDYITSVFIYTMEYYSVF